jgi:uncharacterized protein (DUF983 family)
MEEEKSLEGEWIDVRCPNCGSGLLGNEKGDKWCSNVECDYGLAKRMKAPE